MVVALHVTVQMACIADCCRCFFFILFVAALISHSKNAHLKPFRAAYICQLKWITRAGGKLDGYQLPARPPDGLIMHDTAEARGARFCLQLYKSTKPALAVVAPNKDECQTWADHIHHLGLLRFYLLQALTLSAERRLATSPDSLTNTGGGFTGFARSALIN